MQPPGTRAAARQVRVVFCSRLHSKPAPDWLSRSSTNLHDAIRCSTCLISFDLCSSGAKTSMLSKTEGSQAELKICPASAYNLDTRRVRSHPRIWRERASRSQERHTRTSVPTGSTSECGLASRRDAEGWWRRRSQVVKRTGLTARAAVPLAPAPPFAYR
jgi:hypothetical protein